MQKILLPSFWAIALITVFVLSSAFTDKSLHFFGIAGEREQIISFQYPVEIVQVFVVEGKEVDQGEPILEVRRRQLDTDLNVIDQEIRKYKLQKQETNNTINSQIASLNAKKLATIADIDYDIHSLELRLKVNADILKGISGAQAGRKAMGGNVELNDLKRKQFYSMQAFQAEISHLSDQLNATNRPIDAQINELLQRKEALKRQNIGLKVNAQFHGRIGSIELKAGELVPPFQPIMSVHSRIPRYIKGYIHENILNDIKVGQSVWVRSITLDQNEKPLMGIVESMGNRIVEYPERLKKNPAVSAWGREVVVRLNNLDHALLFGEKVQVLMEKPAGDFPDAKVINIANASLEEIVEGQSAFTIKSSNPEIEAVGIEASGILWRPNTSRYLLISDEEYQRQPSVFIMDEEGMVLSKLSMWNDQRIDDLESISSDDGYIYILSSLSHNKKGDLKPKRKKLIRFKYKNQRINEQREVDLYEVLNTIKVDRTQAGLALFLSQAIENQSIDIESHFIKNNDLYLGFKSPFEGGGNTLIIKINNVHAVFAGEIPQAEIGWTIALLDPETGEPMQLSDMTMVNDELFLLSVSRSALKKSVLWRYKPSIALLEDIAQFHGLKAEGITYLPSKSLFTVVFDEGKNAHSKYLSIPFPKPSRTS